MSDIAIKVENLSKLYQLGEVGTGTLGKDLNRWWARVRGLEDPYAKVGQVNNRSKKAESDFVWALKDINFEVKQGEVLGIIGKNGAGKSTLLKILSKITSPTTGKIYTKGRIASLLEVGTGFHPEMTGRENIYLNGAILGMRKWEIDKKFDEIVDFAGVEAYIDTPVKRYSSGMYVRLAFAVAAFLEPEILIVDEVLAVGDAEFQKKCLGRMKDVSTNDGRTVLFVSHNMGAVKSLCDRALLLENGFIKDIGKVDTILKIYFKGSNDELGFFTNSKLDKKEKIFVNRITLKNGRNEVKESFCIGDNLLIELELISDEFIEKPNIAVGIKTKDNIVTIANTMWDNCQLPFIVKGSNKVSILFDRLPLLPQEYYILIGMRAYDGKSFLMKTKEVAYFNILTKMSDLGINKPFAEEAAMDSISPLIPYKWMFGENNIQEFNICNLAKNNL